MADRPIDFRGPMIRALQEGRKTQDRRILKPQPKWPNGFIRYCKECGWSERVGCELPDCDFGDPVPLLSEINLRYAPGDRLWVREAWNVPDAYLLPQNRSTALGIMIYQATPWAIPGAWRPSIQMPRWASRLTLLVTDVRVQRVQEITKEDALAEGVHPDEQNWDPRRVYSLGMPMHLFGMLWENIHGPGAWDRNDWVEATTFTVEKQNIDSLEGGV